MGRCAAAAADADADADADDVTATAAVEFFFETVSCRLTENLWMGPQKLVLNDENLELATHLTEIIFISDQ